MKPPSPLLGFNNNVRHKGRVFHIQTEDSGVRHPHIITHLFADGGRILKTTKTSYAEYLDSANMGEVVRQMMQDQHKAMFMALRDGQFDPLLEELASRGASGRSMASMPAVLPPGKAAPELPVAPKAAPAAAPPARPATIPPPMPAAAVRPPPIAKLPEPPPITKLSLDPLPPAAPQSPTARSPSVAPTMPAIPVAPVMVPAAPPLSPVAVVTRESAPPEPAATPPLAPRVGGPINAPTTRIRVPSPHARPRLELDPAAIHRAPAKHLTPSGGTLASVVEATVDDGPNIDLGTLERAAAEAETPLFQQIHDLPPPPAAVLGTRAAGGGYSSVSAPAPAPVPSPPSTRGRYAPSRPSSIFSAVRPPEGSSIFGEDLISEKSLDEVILSYLAEDLDGPGEKK